jgi:hypothetical protein
LAGLLMIRQPPANESASQLVNTADHRELEPAPAEPLPSPPPEEIPPAFAEPVAPATPDMTPAPAAPAEPAPAAKKAAKASGPPGRGGGGKEPLKDPLAREALALVGLDPAAEAYWHAAINDPDLSAHERQDLIEDLNEDGLTDPKNPMPEDLPVILSRIHIIEAAGPYAMDQVNADAFQEAYKDLVNMRAKITGQPVPGATKPAGSQPGTKAPGQP